MKIAVIIPCYNEESTIQSVIEDYKNYFTDIYVIDNNCTDNTIEIAKNCGANIIVEQKQGKGASIRTAFNEIDADVLVLTDGDSKYKAKDSEVLIRYLIESDSDMIIGNRLNSYYFNNNPKVHKFINKWNRWISKLASKKYDYSILDLLSGSRVLSKDFYKNIILKCNGFEVETELTKLGILGNYNIDFLDIDYDDIVPNKFSFNTFKHNLKILFAI